MEDMGVDRTGVGTGARTGQGVWTGTGHRDIS